MAPRAVRLVCLVGLLGAAAAFARVAITRVADEAPDFAYFYKAGHWLLRYGALDPGYDVVAGRVEPRGKLDWYWPFVSRLMTLPALLPFRTAGYLWLALNLVAMLATVRLLGRHLSGLPPADWPVTQLLPFYILATYWLWELRLNQIDTLTLLLIVGSFVCWQAGRRGVAGFWLGLAVLLKLTPALLGLWFALKRQYRTLAVAALTVVLAGPAADLAVLGPQKWAAAYRTWFNSAVTTGSQAGLVRTQREMDWRNQSVAAVLSRWLHPTSYTTRFDNDPSIQASYDECPPRTMNVASLPLDMLAHLATAITGLTLLGLVWLARRPADRLTTWQLRFEWALFVLAMLWLMPVMRRYHVVVALPAVSVLAAGVHYAGRHSRWSRLALICVGLVVAGQFTLLHKPLEAAGTVLASVVVLAVPLVVMLLRLGRDPTTLSPPFFAQPARAGRQ